MTSEYRWYKRKGLIEARPVRSDEDWTKISVANSDRASIEFARRWGVIARNPDNHADQWYIHPTYFAKHYELDEEVDPVIRNLIDSTLISSQPKD